LSSFVSLKKPYSFLKTTKNKNTGHCHNKTLRHKHQVNSILLDLEKNNLT